MVRHGRRVYTYRLNLDTRTPEVPPINLKLTCWRDFQKKIDSTYLWCLVFPLTPCIDNQIQDTNNLTDNQ